MSNQVRVRFAPSPTGFMHLGNIRTALLNYLFAKQQEGVLILRIEDTDVLRNVSEAGLQIVKDLEWLGISYDEGPYFQSDRTKIYQEQLDDLMENQKVYRCFCTTEELDVKRKDQVAKKLPPRYDRTCLHLSNDQIKQKIASGKLFIWRFRINEDSVFFVDSMARKNLSFEMKHFSDFALTRSDGSFTFLFTNFVDDWLMGITHVIRGEDHLSNTAMQAALFDAFAVQMPIVWHLPMLCNQEGQKLSKRDFGFSLNDLKAEGFLPQAIENYLAIIGGSFKEEIQSLDELAHNFDFENIHTTGAIRYDLDKLIWINHKWIERLDARELVSLVVPFLPQPHEQIAEAKLLFLIEKVKRDCRTLKDFVGELRFCFEEPEIDLGLIDEKVGKDKANLIATILDDLVGYVPKPELFVETLKREGKEKGLKPKEFFSVVRYLLTGSFDGLGIHDLFEMLDQEKIISRLRKL
ncbi:glutamate--tRNA ligase [Candidatus Dependentiae bacterium]|nr:glutamate--tRNA ligase [Candidatus Dependentiae bacterium]